MFRNIFIVLLLINTTSASFWQYKKEELPSHLLRNYFKIVNEKSYKSNYYIVLNSMENNFNEFPKCCEFMKILYEVTLCKPLVVFEQTLNKDKLIESNNIPHLTKKLAETELIYIFLQNSNVLNITLNTIEKLNKIISYSGYFQFIYCDKYESNLIELKYNFKSIWNRLILNAFFVYYDKNNIFNVKSYNPFNEQIINYNNTSQIAKINSNNYLKNLYGFQFRVAICNDYPRNTYENNETYGQDLNLLKEIVKTINASVKYIYHESCKNILPDIEHGKADFSFIGHFITDNLNVKYTYPISMDDVIILAPLAGTLPVYLNIFLVFGPLAWFSYFVLAITLIILLYVLEKYKDNRQTTFSDIIFAILTISFNNPLTKLSKKTIPIKCLLIAWSTNCFLYNSLFTSSLASVYVKPNRIMNIRFLYELHDAKLDIYVPEDFYKIIPDDNILSEQFFFDNRKNIIENVAKGNLNAAFALPTSIIWNLFRHNLSKSKNYTENYMQRLMYRPKYLPLFDRLIPGHKVYLFPNKTPYLNQINYYLSVDTENVLSKQLPFLHGVRGGRGRNKFHEASKYTAFTLTHLQVFFYLYFIGIGLSLIIFVTEIIKYKFNMNKRQLRRNFTY